jgi:hypothetical protein
MTKKDYLFGRKLHLLGVAALMTLFSFNQKLFAQPDGITVSDGNTEVWYYIENGHSANGHPTNNDGRFGGMITSNGTEVKASMDVIHPTAERGSQKWKVVAVPEEDGFYYLINQNGEYFYRGSDSNYASPTATGDEAKYNLVPVSGTKYFTIRRKGRTDAEMKLEGRNGGDTNAWDLNESNNPVSNSAPTYGLTNSPRSWRFVPESEIDGFYPEIYPKDTPVADVITWSYIKSLDPSISNAPYLTLNEEGTGFELQPKLSENIEKQLFGFIGNGKTAVISGDGGHLTQIVSKADLTKYLNGAAAGSAFNWYLEHVVAPAISETVQGTIRTNRHGSFLIANGNAIAIQAVNAANAGNGATFDTYNSAYNWAYESAPDVTVSLTSSTTGITIVGTVPEASASGDYTLAYDHPFTVTYTVAAGYAPVVKVNDAPVAFGELVDTGDDGSKTYELTIKHITEDTAVEITAEASITVTVNATNVTVVSPTLDDDDQYLSASTSVITFTLNEGYENPAVTIGEAPYALPDPENGVYTVTLSGLTGDTIVDISATIISLPVTITEVTGISLHSPAGSVDYFDDYTFSFSLAEGYHSPKVVVNGAYYALEAPESGTTYTVTLSDVREAKTINVWAFAANVLPVTADTYVGGGDAAGEKGNTIFAADGGLRIQRRNTSAKWTLRTYLQFDLPDAIRSADYDQATLQLVFKNREKPDRSTDFNLEIRPATITGDIADLTWNINGETNETPAVGTVAEAVWVYEPNALNTIDISPALTGDASSIKLQLSTNDATLTPDDGWFEFYSLEGAAPAENIDYIPTLTFSKGTVIDSKEIDDTLVDVKYYTLQGIEVKSPVKGAIYIVKKTYASSKTKVEKTLIRK